MPTDLPAGPALDELVAVQVMGWQRLPDSIDGLVVHRLYRSPAGMETSWVPGFSTNIAHAWEVVEQMKETHEWHIENDQGEVREWIVEVLCFATALRYSAEGEKVMAAICRAALAAVPAAAALR